MINFYTWVVPANTLCKLFHHKYWLFFDLKHLFLSQVTVSGSKFVFLPMEAETVTSWIEQQTGRHHCEGRVSTIGHKFQSYHYIIKWLLGLWSFLLSYFEILEPELWCRWSTWPTPRCLVAVASCISSQRGKKECSCLKRVSHVAVKSHLFTCTNGLVHFFCQENQELNVLKDGWIKKKQREKNIFFCTTWKCN